MELEHFILIILIDCIIHSVYAHDIQSSKLNQGRNFSSILSCFQMKELHTLLPQARKNWP